MRALKGIVCALVSVALLALLVFALVGGGGGGGEGFAGGTALNCYIENDNKVWSSIPNTVNTQQGFRVCDMEVELKDGDIQSTCPKKVAIEVANRTVTLHPDGSVDPGGHHTLQTDEIKLTPDPIVRHGDASVTSRQITASKLTLQGLDKKKSISMTPNEVCIDGECITTDEMHAARKHASNLIDDSEVTPHMRTGMEVDLYRDASLKKTFRISGKPSAVMVRRDRARNYVKPQTRYIFYIAGTCPHSPPSNNQASLRTYPGNTMRYLAMVGYVFPTRSYRGQTVRGDGSSWAAIAFIPLDKDVEEMDVDERTQFIQEQYYAVKPAMRRGSIFMGNNPSGPVIKNFKADHHNYVTLSASAKEGEIVDNETMSKFTKLNYFQTTSLRASQADVGTLQDHTGVNFRSMLLNPGKRTGWYFYGGQRYNYTYSYRNGFGWLFTLNDPRYKGKAIHYRGDGMCIKDRSGTGPKCATGTDLDILRGKQEFMVKYSPTSDRRLVNKDGAAEMKPRLPLDDKGDAAPQRQKFIMRPRT